MNTPTKPVETLEGATLTNPPEVSKPLAARTAPTGELDLGSLIEHASRAGAEGIEALKALIELRNAEGKRIAESAFNEAMIAFQAECPTIPHDQTMHSKGRKIYSYASIEQVLKVIQPLLTKYQLAHSFNIDEVHEGEKVVLSGSCRITHVWGHFKESSMQLPVEVKGSMGPTQATMATRSYLRRGTLTNVLGLTSAEADNDASHGRGDDAQQEPAKQKMRPPPGLSNADIIEVKARMTELRVSDEALNANLVEATKGKIGDWRKVSVKRKGRLLELIAEIGEGQA